MALAFPGQTNSHDSRRKTKAPGLSPMHAKIDIGLKKQLLAAEAERTAKAKRDAEDER